VSLKSQIVRYSREFRKAYSAGDEIILPADIRVADKKLFVGHHSGELELNFRWNILLCLRMDPVIPSTTDNRLVRSFVCNMRVCPQLVLQGDYLFNRIREKQRNIDEATRKIRKLQEFDWQMKAVRFSYAL
jgi:hypothetical protein